MSRPLLLGCLLATLVAASSSMRKEKDAPAGRGGTPKFRWGQTLKELVVTIDEPCEEEQGHALDVKFGIGSVQIRCTDDDGLRFELSFEPREDILPARSACAAKAGQMAKTVVCRLQKKYVHVFDRLAVRSDPLRKYMDVDWSMFTGLDTRDENEDPVDLAFDEDSLIQTTTPDELEDMMTTHKGVYAEVSFPWCQQCQPQRENLEKVARLVKKGPKKPDFAIVYVDAREHREFDRRLNFSCNKKCHIYLFKKAEGGIGQPLAVPAGSDGMEPERIVATLKHVVKDLIKTVTTQKADGMFKKAAARLAEEKFASAKGFGVFGKEHAELAKMYTDLQFRVRREHLAGTLPPLTMQHHIVHAEELQGHTAPAWAVLRPDGSQAWLDLTELTARASWDTGITGEAMTPATALLFWMAASSKPLCHPLGPGDSYIYDHANISTVTIFVDPKAKSKEHHPAFYKELAAQYAGRIAFVMKPIEPKEMILFGIEPDHQTPSLGLLAYYHRGEQVDEEKHPERMHRPPYYRFGGDVNVRADVEEWLAQYLAGTLPVYFRSQKRRWWWESYGRCEPGQVKTYTADEIHHENALAAGGRDIILALTKPWRHEESDELSKGFLSQLAGLTKAIGGLVVGEVDLEVNELSETAVTLAKPGDRTIWGLQMDDEIRSILGVIPATGDNAGKYLEFPAKSEYTLRKVLLWLKQNSPQVEAHYGEVEAAILADEAANAAETAFGAEKAGLLAATPVAEHENGHLKVQILQSIAAPDAAKPRHGDMVRYHSIAKVSETDIFTQEAWQKENPDVEVPFGKVFRNSREAGQPREVVLGAKDDQKDERGDYIKCIDAGLRLLRVGDRAYLTCHHDLGFGEQGTWDGEVPPNTQTEWDVAIVQIIEPKKQAEPEKEPQDEAAADGVAHQTDEL